MEVGYLPFTLSQEKENLTRPWCFKLGDPMSLGVGN